MKFKKIICVVLLVLVVTFVLCVILNCTQKKHIPIPKPLPRIKPVIEENKGYTIIDNLMTQEHLDYSAIVSEFDTIIKETSHPLATRDAIIRRNQYVEAIKAETKVPNKDMKLLKPIEVPKIPPVTNNVVDSIAVVAILGNQLENLTINDTQSTHDTIVYRNINDWLNKINITPKIESGANFIRRISSYHPFQVLTVDMFDGSYVPFRREMLELDFYGILFEYIEAHVNKENLWTSMADVTKDWFMDDGKLYCSTGRITKAFSAFNMIDDVNPVELKTKATIQSEIYNKAGQIMLEHQNSDKLKETLRTELTKEYVTEELIGIRGDVNRVIDECVEAIV